MNFRDRQILGIAVPSIVSNITVPLLGLVDVAIVGHLGGAAYIGAITLGGMLFNVIYWLFGFLRMGTSGMTSQALGKRQLCDVSQLLVRSLIIALSIAFLFIVLQIPIRDLIFLLMKPAEGVRDFTVTYFSICIWGAPAMLGLYGLSGWFIGMQNSRIPMLIAITQNVVNIAASLVFVFVLKMKVEGVALGTLIAQWGGFAMGLFLLFRYYGRLRRHFAWKGMWEQASVLRFFKVNRDIFFRTVCMVSVLLFFTSAGSWQGEVMLAVNTLLMQFYLLVSYIMDGFAYAAEAMSGKFYGAGNFPAFRDTVRRSFAWGGVCTVFFTLLYIVGGDAFLRLLTDEPSVVSASRQYVWWVYLIPVCSIGAFIWDGIYIGITASRQMLLSMVAASVSFFVVYGSLYNWLGNHGLWLSFIIFLFTRGWMQTVLYFKFLRFSSS